MQITVTVGAGADKVLAIEVDPAATLDVVKSMLAIEAGIPVEEQVVTFNGQPLNNPAQTLDQAGVKPNDLLVLMRQARAAPPAFGGQPSFGGQQRSSADSARELYQRLRNDPALLENMAQRSPELAAAARNPDPTQFIQLVQRLEQQEMQARMQRAQQIQQLNNNWWDPEAQAKIEEAIRQENVMSNFEQAMEYTPEAFGSVVMLYVDSEVNGHHVKAFVDSGAQSTIMSVRCAERCGLMRLIDRRFAGIAKGVGTAKIVGRVHMAQIKIGGAFVASSFTIIDQDSMEFLIGLDWLKHHQCQIDLRENVLRVGDKAVVPFLSEKDIPRHLREESGEIPPGSPAPAKSADPGPTPSTTTTTTSSSANPPAATGSLIPGSLLPPSLTNTAPAAAPAPAPAPAAQAPAPVPAAQPQANAGAGSLIPPNLLAQMQQPQGQPAAAAPVPAPAPAAAPTAPAGGGGSAIDPAKVQQLTAMGFSDAQARGALEQTNGDIELAGALLFEQGFYN